MNDEEFHQLVDAAVASIPEEFLQKLDNVAVVVEDLPTPSQLQKLRARGERGFLLGLYEGVPQTKRRYYGIGGQLPDKITIFRRPLLAISRTKVDLMIKVRNTVIHEIAHHFGMNEEQVRGAEGKREKRFKSQRD